jgi:hypothetical protein
MDSKIGTRLIISSKPEKWSKRFNIKNMLIKKSCKLYCIRDLYEDGVLRCKKGNIYNAIVQTSNRNTSFLYITIQTDNIIIRFNKYSPFHEYTIPEHFITEQGFRKLKLEKLNNSL